MKRPRRKLRHIWRNACITAIPPAASLSVWPLGFLWVWEIRSLKNWMPALQMAILSIGAVKGFEIGDGFSAAASTGLSNNDAFVMDNGQIAKATNHSGGTLGGMSDGSPLVFRAAVKPTPSIASAQHTVNDSGEEISIAIKGRHDPIIVPRAVVVVESMAAITILDALLANMTAKLDRIVDFYK